MTAPNVMQFCIYIIYIHVKSDPLHVQLVTVPLTTGAAGGRVSSPIRRQLVEHGKSVNALSARRRQAVLQPLGVHGGEDGLARRLQVT